MLLNDKVLSWKWGEVLLEGQICMLFMLFVGNEELFKSLIREIIIFFLYFQLGYFVVWITVGNIGDKEIKDGLLKCYR